MNISPYIISLVTLLVATLCQSISAAEKPNTVEPPPYSLDDQLFRSNWAKHYHTIRVTDSDVKKIMNDLEKNDFLKRRNINNQQSKIEESLPESFQNSPV